MSVAHSLKVGIDFGTTYSGVAWAHTSAPDEINVIQKWPSGGNKTSDKVPTELKYSPKYELGYGWGCEVAMELDKLVWIKLLLDPSQDSYADDLLAKTRLLIPEGKRPVDLMIDFLRALKKHTLYTLESHYGKDFMEITKVEYFLTVPAVWSDSAKALTLYAAEAVGLGNKNSLCLISEPEAAAVYCLRVQPNQLEAYWADLRSSRLRGGTVDLISYEIVAIEPKLQVKECVMGSGGMCGSTYINRRFGAWVESRIGATLFNKQKPRSRAYMMDHFEGFLKRSFSGDETQSFHCPVPGVPDDEDAGLEDGFLTMTVAEMKSIFDPVVDQVIRLVQQQIQSVEGCGRKVSAVLLVGGFGASEYLKRRLEIVACSPKHIPLMQPPNAWTAVANGACQRGLEGISMVRTQLARRSYGVLCVKKHPGNPSTAKPKKNVFVDPLTGEVKIDNRVSWFIVRGSTVSEHTVIKYPFFFAVATNHNLIFENTLLACATSSLPQNARNPNVFKVCTLKSNLNIIPRSSFDKKVGENGQTYYHIEFNLTMQVQGALVFGFEFKGKTYYSTEANFA